MPAQGSHLLRIVQGAPRFPDALPEALVCHPLWGHANPQPRRPSPGGPRRPRVPPPARPRTCSSSCALATAICTFTCSMMRPGSSLPPPPEPPKSEPKPLSIAPPSLPARGRMRRPVPAPEVGRPWLHGKWSPDVLGAGRWTGPQLPQARRYVGSRNPVFRLRDNALRREQVAGAWRGTLRTVPAPNSSYRACVGEVGARKNPGSLK